MKILKSKEEELDTDYGQYRIRCELVEYDPEEDEKTMFCEKDVRMNFGLRLWQFKKGESAPYDYCEAKGVTSDLREAHKIYGKITKGKVMPVNLYEVVDDLMSDV